MCGFTSERFHSVSTYIDTGTQAQVVSAKMASQQTLSIWICRLHKKRNVCWIPKGHCGSFGGILCCLLLWGFLRISLRFQILRNSLRDVNQVSISSLSLPHWGEGRAMNTEITSPSPQSGLPTTSHQLAAKTRISYRVIFFTGTPTP